MKQQNYEVEILVNNRPIREYFKNNNVFIEGKKDTRYSIKIKNNSSQKVLATPTVDGLSVVNGKEASYSSPGYIVDGYSSIIIDGWRTGNKNIAKFYFTSPEDSYNRHMNKQNNLGIIGVVIFREKEKYETQPLPFFYPEKTYPLVDPYAPSWYLSDSTSLSTTNSSNVRTIKLSKNLGTGFGEQKQSEVITVDFEKEKTPDSIFEIYYNTKKELKKIGIDFHSKPMYISSQAFPNQFCKQPKY